MSKSLISQAFTVSRRVCSMCHKAKMMGAERYSKTLRKLLWLCVDCQTDKRDEIPD